MTMAETTDLETVSSEALQKLGRYIVNFSKVEGALKYLLSVSKFDDISKESLSKNQERLRKQSLGRLVQEFHNTVMVNDVQSESQPESSSEGISLSFNITYEDLDFLKAQKQALSNIVAERNRLIHQDLALLDINSIEDYRKLINLLDEQNPRLLAHLSNFGWILKSFNEVFKDFQSFVKSPDFPKFISSDHPDA